MYTAEQWHEIVDVGKITYHCFDNFDSRAAADVPPNDVGLTRSFGWNF